MRKRVSKVKLGVDKDHTKAILKNLANSLILEESIETSRARAKAVVPFVERLITIGKRDSLHHNRIIFDKLRNKESVKKLVDEILPRMKSRNSGFLRTIKTRNLAGDNSLMYRVAFVDYEPESKRVRPSKKKASKAKSSKKDKKEDKDDDNKGGGLFGRFRGGKKDETKESQVKGNITDAKSNTRTGI